MARLNYTRIGRRSPRVKVHKMNSPRFHIRITVFCRILVRYLKSLRRRICKENTGGSFPRSSSREGTGESFPRTSSGKGLVSGRSHVVGQQQDHISGSYCGHSNSFSVDPIADCLEFIRMNSVSLGSSS